jgi:hypothetical protein
MASQKLRAHQDVWWKTRSKFSCCCRTSSVYKECRRCIQSSGIELSGLTLEPLASSDAVLSQEEVALVLVEELLI